MNKLWLIILVIFSALSGGYLGFQWASGSHTESQRLQSKAKVITATPQLLQSQHEAENAPGETRTVESIPANNAITNLQAIVKLPSEFAQYSATYAIAQNLNEAQVMARLGQARQLADTHDVVGLSRIFFSRYVELNGQRASDYFFEHFGAQEQYKSLLLEIYHEWAFLDPEATAANIRKLTQADFQQDIILSLVGAPVFSHSNEVQLLAKLLPPNLQQYAQYAVIRNQGHEQAFRYFLALDKSDPQRRAGLRRAFYDLAKQDPVAALSYLPELDNAEDVRNYQVMVISMLAKTDGEMAVEQAIKLDGDSRNKSNKLLVTALEQIAASDGQKAFELAQTHKALLDNKINMRLLSGWARNDPRAAAGYWQHNLGLTNKENVHGLASSYAEKYPQEAYEWAQDLKLPKHILRMMVNTFARNDLSQAQSYLQNSSADNQSVEQRSLFISSIAELKSRDDIKGARQWLDQFENEKGYLQAKDQLMNNWIHQDPQGAAGEVLFDEQKERYIGSLVQSWYSSDPQSTQQWVLSIEGDVLRDQALAILIPKVAQNDAALAEDLMQTVVDEQVLKNLQRRLVNQ